MRDPETARLLSAVRVAVANARAGGVTERACIFDATAAAIDCDPRSWPSPEARRTTDDACRAVEPCTVMADPAPRPKPRWLARVLYAAANRIPAPAAAGEGR